jgi:DNA-binding beta-propeller fold protein YncE
MKPMTAALALASAALAPASAPAAAQQPAAPPAAAPQPFAAGKPLGVTADGRYLPMSNNVKVYGGAVSAESCSYDAARKLIMVVSRGANQNEAPNDGFVALLNHDGSVHTAKWIGATRDGLVLNQPFGSDVHAGKLYLADSNGDTADGAPRIAVIRMFDLATGAPAGEVVVPDAAWFNDIAVARDGTIYATQTGTLDGKTPWRLFKLSPDGKAKLLIDGAPLARPNGVAIDNDGNVVVVNMLDTKVMTFSPDGGLLRTEQAAQTGSDGLVIMPDGTKYVSSVTMGGISRIRAGRAAELIATGVPSAASMCLDPDANQLVIPLNPNNAVAFLTLR